MITTCTVCQARYRLEAAKVPPRIMRVRCPDCGGVFVLDGTVPPQEEAAPMAGLETGFAGTESETPTAAPEAAIVADVPTPAPSAWDETQVETSVDPKPPVASPSPSPVAAAPTDPPAPTVTPAPAAATVAQDTGTAVATAEAETPAGGRRKRSKEEMLARALVSDILVYNRDLRDTAMAEGNLLEALGGEIKKSWELYKEKVTPEVANSTNHFRDALNAILAEGEQIF